ncbi:MAG TPA: class II glutamine amidotransferase [Thermoplasmata archaeon]|nr:class II glutamine amidotransferase [Thermoplasmata archaeon]
MCRLFGMLGNPSTPADPWLIATDRSLLAQSNASAETRQPDGWGIAWYTDARAPQVDKGAGGAYEESERFTRSARAAKGPVVVGHLRHASNPMNLPHERLIGMENSQPFSYHSYLFAHNGHLPHPRETRPLLGRFESEIRGVNDSEVLFWLLVKHVEALGDPLAAYSQTVGDLWRVWEETGRTVPEPYSGLNVVFTRGPNELWAFCHWRGEHGGGLLDDRRPYYQMAYSADAKLCVVGSEPFDSTRRDWKSLQNGEYLVARSVQGLVAVEVGAIPLAKMALAPLAT